MGDRAGRKPQGWKLIDALEGDARDKARVKAFLQTLSGECTVDEACAALGLHPSWFFDLRNRWLQDSLNALARPLGRPAKRTEVDEGEVAELRRQMRELQQRLNLAELRQGLHEAARDSAGPAQGKKTPVQRAPRQRK